MRQLETPEVQAEFEFDSSDRRIHHEETSESVTCAECGTTIPQFDALKVQKHTDGKDITLYFCGEAEANEYYINQLRRGL